MNDPDSVLSTLTREVKEVGPDGEEVKILCTSFHLCSRVSKAFLCDCDLRVFQVTKVVPALSEEVKDALIKNIRRRMTPQPTKIQADIEMTCFAFDGVLHIQVLFFSPYRLRISVGTRCLLSVFSVALFWSKGFDAES